MYALPHIPEPVCQLPGCLSNQPLFKTVVPDRLHCPTYPAPTDSSVLAQAQETFCFFDASGDGFMDRVSLGPSFAWVSLNACCLFSVAYRHLQMMFAVALL